MEVPLLVVPEGYTQFKNTAGFVDLRSKKQYTADLAVVVPKNAVPDSTKVEISAIGNPFKLSKNKRHFHLPFQAM